MKLVELYKEYVKNREAMDWYEKNANPMMDFWEFIESYNEIENIFLSL